MARNIRSAARYLMEASASEIQTIALHDWDMIRDVASWALAYGPQPSGGPGGSYEIGSGGEIPRQRPQHADNCDWHLDQYDNECTCGAVPKPA